MSCVQCRWPNAALGVCLSGCRVIFSLRFWELLRRAAKHAERREVHLDLHLHRLRGRLPAGRDIRPAGRTPVTTSTIVATVNGEDIPYMVWANTSTALAQQQEQQTGRSLTMDERAEVDQQAFDQLVNDVLLRQEYEKRGIRVTDEEVIETAKYSPPPQFRQNPEFLTDGQFDIAKYRRFLASPAARQQGSSRSSSSTTAPRSRRRSSSLRSRRTHTSAIRAVAGVPGPQRRCRSRISGCRRTRRPPRKR